MEVFVIVMVVVALGALVYCVRWSNL
jgi:hypothetical protein